MALLSCSRQDAKNAKAVRIIAEEIGRPIIDIAVRLHQELGARSMKGVDTLLGVLTREPAYYANITADEPQLSL